MSASGSGWEVRGTKDSSSIVSKDWPSERCVNVADGCDVVVFEREEVLFGRVGVKAGIFGAVVVDTVDHRLVSLEDGTEEGAVEGAVEVRFKLSYEP